MASLTAQRAAPSLIRSLNRASRASLAHTSAKAHPPQRAFITTRAPLLAQATSSTPSTPAATANASPSNSNTADNAPPPTTARAAAQPTPPPIQDILKTGLADAPPPPPQGTSPSATAPADTPTVDWTTSYHGLSAASFAPDVAAILLAPLDAADIEVKPDGIVYLPEIKYRRILNRAFGPGGWGLAPRGETIVTSKSVTREYALLAHGRLISIARGEQDYFEPAGIPTATEGCKSNALMRCCKDLGVASELWDPRFIRRFMREHARDVWVEHAVTKKKRKISLRKDDEPRYPYLASKA